MDDLLLRRRIMLAQGETEEPLDYYETIPLTIEVTRGAGSMYISFSSTIRQKVEYRKNDGSWTSLPSSIWSVSVGDIFQFRTSLGDSSDPIYNERLANFHSMYFNVYGNVMSLVRQTTFAEEGRTYQLQENQFANLFSGNSDNPLEDASNLRLPSRNLAKNCYSCFFYYAPFLTAPPTELPATIPAQYCYYRMFYSTPIATAPVLRLTTLVSNCLTQMFYNCSSLEEIRLYSTKALSASYANYWVYGVKSSGKFYKISGVSHTSGVNGIPSGWSKKNL